MATSGRINTGSSNGSYFYVKWELDEQDVAGNRSHITWRAGIHISGGEYWLTNAVRIDGGSVNGVAIPPGTWSNIRGAGDHNLRTGGIWIPHNGDGTKSFSANINGWLFSFGNRSKSGSWSLPTIPRATKPSIPSSFNVGSNVTISLPRASSSFTHTVTYSFNGASGTIGSGIGTSVVWSVPTSLANTRPNNTSGKGTITARTYNGSKLIGTKTASFTANIPDTSSFWPTITGFTYEEANEDVKDHFSVFIQSKSRLAMTISGQGVYGSTVNKGILNIAGAHPNGWSAWGFSATSDPLPWGGTMGVGGLVVDTRGRVSEGHIETISVEEYVDPTIVGVLAWRINGEGYYDEEGDIAAIFPFGLIAPVNNENTEQWILKYKKHGESEWEGEIEITPTTDYMLLGEDDVVILYDVDVDSSYDVRLEATDYFKTTVYDTNIPTAYTIMDFHVDGKGMSFGKVADQTNRLEVGPKLPMSIFAPSSDEEDAGFLRLRRLDDSLLSYIATGPDGTGLNMHMYDDGEAWSGKVAISETGDVTATGLVTDAASTYSTSEVATGEKWVDGKTIYRKTINFGALPNSTSKTVNHSISNLSYVIKMDCVATNGTNFLGIPRAAISAPEQFNIEIYAHTTGVRIQTGSDRSDYNAYVTMYYTKSV